MSVIDLLFNPQARLLVGVSDRLDADGSLRIYLNARYTGLHTHCSDSEGIERVRAAWAGGAMGHQSVIVADDALCDCPEEQ
jgi:hypothetical protein